MADTATALDANKLTRYLQEREAFFREKALRTVSVVVMHDEHVRAQAIADTFKTIREDLGSIA